MMRVCVLAALVAYAAAAGHQAKTAAGTFEVTAAGYKVNGASVAVADGIKYSMATNDKSAAFGNAYGAKLATAELAYTIDLKKKELADTLAANVDLQAKIDGLATAMTNGDADIKRLQGEIDAAGVKPAKVVKALGCLGGCSTHGDGQAVVLLDGETYAGVTGLIVCAYKLSNGKTLSTNGVGIRTGKSGKASAIACNTPVFAPGDVKSKTFTAEISVRVGALAEFEDADSSTKRTIVFKAVGPVISHIEKEADLKTTELNKDGEATFDFVVTDTDSTFTQISGAVVLPNKDHIASAVVRRIADLGKGNFHMQVAMKPQGKPKSATATVAIKISVKDNFNPGAKVAEVHVNFLAMKNGCFVARFYDFSQSCNTPTPAQLSKRKENKKFHDTRISYNDNKYRSHGGGFNDHFATWHETYLVPTKSGNYNFETASDDGSMIYFDGRLILNNDGCHGRNHRRGSISLTAGKMYKVDLTFFENGGGANHDVWWWGPGFGRRHFAGDQLKCMPL